MKRVILHIGQSKTGTSSLQEFLAANRDKLRSRGVLYPDILRSGSYIGVPNHNWVADSLVEARIIPELGAEEYFGQFRSALSESGCHTLLLSGESFWGGEPQVWNLHEGTSYLDCYTQKLERLSELLGNAEREVVVYLRRQDDWLHSVVGHLLLYEGLLGRKVYESDAQIVSLMWPRLEYDKLLQVWESVIQPSRLHVIPFERQTLTGGDTVIDFLHRMELDELSYGPPAKRRNLSLDRSFIQLKKALNHIPKSKDTERTVIAMMRASSRNFDKRKPFRIDEDLTTRTLARLRPSNRNLARRYGGNSEDFFTVCPPSFEPDRPDVPETLAACMRFDDAFFSARGRLTKAERQLATLLRTRLPWVHAQARQIRMLLGR